ncbi:MAG: hypothetical protein AB7F40_06880 [Victivallaceae bacterium]|nr:hypothetical protein [Victivallaceae bacterium]
MKTTVRLLAVFTAGWALLLEAGPAPDGSAADLELRVSNRALSIGCGAKPLAVVEARASSRELALNIFAAPESGQTFQLTVPSASGFRFRQTLGSDDNGGSSYGLYLNFNGIFTLRSGGFENFAADDGSAMRRTWEYIYEFTPRTAYLQQEGLRETPAAEAAAFIENTTYRADERKLSPENGEPLAGTGPLFDDFTIPDRLPQMMNAGTFRICKLSETRYYAAEVAGLPGRSFVIDFVPASGVLRIVFFDVEKTVCQVEFDSAGHRFKAFFSGVFQGIKYSANVEEPEKGKAFVRACMESGGESGEFFFRLDPAAHTFHLDRQSINDRN